MEQPCNQARLSADGDFRNYFLVLFSSIVKDYGRVGCRRRPQQSSITTVVQSHKWGVSYAPAPSDIVWSVPTLLDRTFFLFLGTSQNIMVPVLLFLFISLKVNIIQFCCT